MSHRTDSVYFAYIILYSFLLIQNVSTSLYIYRVCHGFRLAKRDDYFWVNFHLFKIENHFYRQLWQVCNSAWASNRSNICKFSLPKSVKHSVYIFRRHASLKKSLALYLKWDKRNKLLSFKPTTKSIQSAYCTTHIHIFFKPNNMYTLSQCSFSLFLLSKSYKSLHTFETEKWFELERLSF